MAVKVITDSLSDITSDVAEKYGITVVPLTVLFGKQAYLDRVTITTDEFYDRLIHGNIWPTTTQPAPGDFADVYSDLSEETDEILVITLSSKLSGTYQSAMSAKGLHKKKTHIEVIDSQTVAGGLGLIVLAAAKAAQSGVKLNELADYTRKAKARSHIAIYLDTLKYLAKGGRIGKAKELLGSLLSIKQILTVKEGEMAPLTRFRSLSAGMDYMYNFTASFQAREAVAVEHTTAAEEADKLTKRIGKIFPEDQIYRSTVSPVLGVHGGPGAIAVTVLEAEKK